MTVHAPIRGPPLRHRRCHRQERDAYFAAPAVGPDGPGPHARTVTPRPDQSEPARQPMRDMALHLAHEVPRGGPIGALDSDGTGRQVRRPAADGSGSWREDERRWIAPRLRCRSSRFDGWPTALRASRDQDEYREPPTRRLPETRQRNPLASTLAGKQSNRRLGRYYRRRLPRRPATGRS